MSEKDHEKITDADEKDREDHYNRQKNNRFPGAIWAPDLCNKDWLKYKEEINKQVEGKEIEVVDGETRVLQPLPKAGK